MNKANKAAARFFLPIGQIGRANERFNNDLTMPLFPLWLILDADGTLAPDVRERVLNSPLDSTGPKSA